MLWVLGVVDLVRFVRWMLVFCWLVNLCVVRRCLGFGLGLLCGVFDLQFCGLAGVDCG